jgi:Ca2+-binding EF-hand superfamily protein
MFQIVNDNEGRRMPYTLTTKLCRSALSAAFVSSTFSTAAYAALDTPAVKAASVQAPVAKPTPQPLTRATVITNANASFAQIDANHDGVITKDELDKYAHAQQRAQAVARNRAAFDALDTNHDGSLSREEFAKLADRLPPLDVSKLFAQFDAKHDGRVTLEEFRAPTLAEFDSMDTNHDGVVSPEEARAAAAKRNSASH